MNKFKLLKIISVIGSFLLWLACLIAIAALALL